MVSTLNGEVQRVTFENEETGFRVLKVEQKSPPGSVEIGRASCRERVFSSV